MSDEERFHFSEYVREYVDWHKGSAHDDDPIAEQLVDAMKYIPDWVWGRAERIQRAVKLNQGKNLQEKMWAMGQAEDMAQYEMYDFVHSDDEEVIYLLNRLGVNPVTTKKVTIVVEQGQPVQFVTEGFALSSPDPHTGAIWK